MVVFEDGLAKKSDYRRFSVTHGTDDTAAMAEVVRRRFARHLKEEADRRDEQGIAAEEGRPRRFAYPPNLLVVDGGAPQVAAASRSLDELGIVDVAICGLAKRMEEVWLPGETDPVILPRTSEALYLLQRVRDEAHRFAITYHRQKRSTSMLVSAAGRRPRPRRDAAEGADEAVRVAQAAARGHRRGAHGRARHRSADGGGDPGRDRGAGDRRSPPEQRGVRRPAPVRPGRLVTDPDFHAQPSPSLDPTSTETQPLEVVVVTGLSGAGKLTAGRVLEDLGCFVVDNLPPGLLLPMVELGARGDLTPVRGRGRRPQPGLLQRPARRR